MVLTATQGAVIFLPRVASLPVSALLRCPLYQLRGAQPLFRIVRPSGAAGPKITRLNFWIHRLSIMEQLAFITWPGREPWFPAAGAMPP